MLYTAITGLIRGLLLNQQEHLPVRVEAAIALNQFVCQQHKIAQYMTQSLKEILEGTTIFSYLTGCGFSASFPH